MSHTPPDPATVIAAGVQWLYGEQPPGALVSHHGLTLYANNGRSYSFTPSGYQGSPVVCVDVIHPQVNPATGEPKNRLRDGEMQDLLLLLAEADALTVGEPWNGPPGTTGSVRLEKEAHPTLLEALGNYRRGCPQHPREGVFCKCGWSKEGRARLRVPGAELRTYPEEPRLLTGIPRQRTGEPDPQGASEAPKPVILPATYAEPTPGLLRRVLAGLAKILDVPEPVQRVEAKFTCSKCGMKATFEGTDLDTFEAELVGVWKGHTCSEPPPEER